MVSADNQSPTQLLPEELQTELQNIRELLEQLISLHGQEPKQQRYLEGVPIPAPFPGIFYRAPEKDKPPHVEEGDRVKEGDVVGVMETNKTFSDILSPVSGEVTAIFKKNKGEITQEQEGQPLMLIKPDDDHHPQIVSLEVDDEGIPIILALEKDSEEIEDLFVRSSHVGVIKKRDENESPWLVDTGDIIQPQQEIVTIEVLKRFLSITYRGERPAKIVELLVKENDIVQYGSPVARFEPIEESNNQK